ncbi:MAG: hypothetical protein GEU74_04070 [Nitriliruptorales bacterium]|nr:hypothetical protein [Nitriliruptorales bacterium]
MKYRRVVNRRLGEELSSADPEDLALVAPCWPEDASLPRVVQRNGEVVLDEGWVRIEDEADEPDPAAGI